MSSPSTTAAAARPVAASPYLILFIGALVAIGGAVAKLRRVGTNELGVLPAHQSRAFWIENGDKALCAEKW